MPGVKIWGWDATPGAEQWRPILIDATGRFIIDPSAIFENPPTEDEAGKAPTSEWAYDHWQDPIAHHPACLPLTGGAMTGVIAMGANKITGLADPTLAQDAATRAYVLARCGLYLPLTGGTLTGDLNIGAHKLKTTDLLLKQLTDTKLVIRNAADTGYRNLELQVLYLHQCIQGQTDGAYILARPVNNNSFLFYARDSGVGNAEVARLQGAADPYFQATLPMVLLPIATASLPTTPVEGMITYDDTLKRQVYYNGTIWVASLPEADKYTDEEAVLAMGAKADDNPLHHDKAEEWGATEHTAIGDGAPHHVKYTNAQAVAAAKTVKLDDFATPDDNTDLNASTTRHGLLRKLDNVVTHFLNGQGGWTTPAGVGATKEFFVPVTSYYNGAAYAAMGGHSDYAAALLTTLDHRARVSFKVPHDFSSITNAEIIVVPLATQAVADWDIFSDYGAIGEDFRTHAEQDATSTYNVVNGQLFAIDISGILSALAADDYVGIQMILKNSNHDVAVLGIRFKYS